MVKFSLRLFNIMFGQKLLCVGAKRLFIILTRISQRAFINDSLVSCSAQHVCGKVVITRHSAAFVETAPLSSIKSATPCHINLYFTTQIDSQQTTLLGTNYHITLRLLVHKFLSQPTSDDVK